ncbi:MAG: SHOCT domain-containing protein [Ilumatobacteraceae bacterium]
MPAGFVVLFVLILIGGLAMGAVNAAKARDLAERTGEDPGRAMRRMWFAQDPRAELRHMEREADLHQEQERMAKAQRETNERLRRAELAAAAAAAAAARDAQDDRPASERLEELQELYRRGLVNEDEFSEKRREILGDV